MNTLRLPYQTLSPDAYRGFGATKKALEKSSLGKQLIELVYLRVSQINGCAFCLEMHAAALRAGGVPDAKLDSLAGWRASPHFSERERVALAWTESLADVAESHAPDEDFEPLKAHFSEAEIADLSFAVALMSAFNRLAIGMRQ
ncbi:TPA: carboxymuconolactone decarboxylase family protein [Burkholderia aenigmatica]|uniref:carboxymuconolactone decarboxylase family protein n=1 Tax=Burkholderia sp. AU45251 TaxID=3059204 RepID=UPI002650F7AE|nr:carboxymuconolactone decarboxylase family protein [Burkholderia sp. AU45251]HDR9482175.1 carboxymuconolactone decarboxylase family protein [Burkholderia aenigmatica]MDN7515190.1 carboxymuconolactone decarboxylase family protein [Burkholderia sp. AU45251]HDR9515642.1 carboxymuconolactone decarboxylase family protein [Burkholderia aenigmatica]HDR9590546.1 carboxymuconolactone decarboxylase family protein [Burkholderia aenigmatica]HDR9598919.1 carboxymuconolactone decarboxylase family protein 